MKLKTIGVPSPLLLLHMFPFCIWQLLISVPRVFSCHVTLVAIVSTSDHNLNVQQLPCVFQLYKL